MFQNNIYSGILFLVGICYNSLLLGLGALAGTIVGTVTAHALKYSKKNIADGLYGFNGALTGIAIVYFFEVNLTASLLLMASAALTTLIMKQSQKFIPPFTAPFVIVSWLVIYAHPLFDALISNSLFADSFLSELALVSTHPASTQLSPHLLVYGVDIVAAISNSFGQVMFQENIITGLLFLSAIFINNRLMAVYAVYAATLASLIGWMFAEPASAISAGIMGYNAILCAIALAGNTADKRLHTFIWVSAAIVLSTLLNSALATTGLITLTAPFVLVTWFILSLKKAVAN